MPKVDPRELLTDRTKYPDDMVIQLVNGDEISVKDYRDIAMPKGDFTKASEGWAARERELRSGLDTASQNLANALREKQEIEARAAANPGRSAPVISGSVTEDELAADPVLGPLVKRLRDQESRLNQFQETAQQRLQDHENAFLATQFRGQLASIAARHNARFKEKPFDEAKFLDDYQRSPVMRFDPTTKRSLPDLDTFHRTWAYDDDVRDRESAAEQRGVEKGKQAAKVPRVPFGRRSAPAQGDQGPKDFRELKIDDILNDDEVMAPLRGEQE